MNRCLSFVNVVQVSPMALVNTILYGKHLMLSLKACSICSASPWVAGVAHVWSRKPRKTLSFEEAGFTHSAMCLTFCNVCAFAAPRKPPQFWSPPLRLLFGAKGGPGALPLGLQPMQRDPVPYDMLLVRWIDTI